jgi:hypothetical protein
MDILFFFFFDISACSDCFVVGYSLVQGCRNPGHQLTVVNKFCLLAPSTCNLLNVNFLMPSILRWHLDFWKICAPLVFWVIHWWFVIDVSEELTASIFRPAEGEEYSSLPALKTEAVSSSKTLVSYQLTWHHILEDCSLCQWTCEHLKLPTPQKKINSFTYSG